MKINALFVIAGTSACLLSLAASGCGGSGGGSTQAAVTSSGIQGHAQFTSHAGPSYVGEPASTPTAYSGATLAVEPSGGGNEIAQTTTDAKGNFSFSLAPGTYLLVPELTTQEQQSLVTAQPQTVTVVASQFAAVIVAYSQSLP